MNMLRTKFMDDYMDNDSNAGVFMSTLFFPLTCTFRDIFEIVNFIAGVYASIYLDHYYIVCYNKIEEYDLNVYQTTERGETKKYSAFSHSAS